MITIYCVACAKEVEAQSLFGDSIYPHRPDLYGKKFLQCPHCGNYVGTHQDGRPLGTIPTPELRAMRNKVHAEILKHCDEELMRGASITVVLRLHDGTVYSPGYACPVCGGEMVIEKIQMQERYMMRLCHRCGTTIKTPFRSIQADTSF